MSFQALESEVPADAEKPEEFPQGPTNPKVLLDAYRLQTHLSFNLLKGQQATRLGDLEKRFFGSKRWSNQQTNEICNPSRGMVTISQNGWVIRIADKAADYRNHGLVHLIQPDMAEGLNQRPGTLPLTKPLTHPVKVGELLQIALVCSEKRTGGEGRNRTLVAVGIPC